MPTTEEEMARDLTLTYNGPALGTGRMAVGELAPALLALADLFHEVNAVAYPTAPPVRLDIQAFDRGSFDVSLHLATQDIITFLNQDHVQVAAMLIGLVADSAQGVFAALRWLRGRSIVRRQPTMDGKTRITTADGDTLEVPPAVSVLIERGSAQKHVRVVVRPLKEEGVDSLTIHRPGQPSLQITDNDVPALEERASGDAVVDQEVEMVVSIVALSFIPGNKWRLSAGGMIFFAGIGDEGFLARVQASQELFASGDSLRARMRLRQWLEPGSPPQTEWTVLEVLEHYRGAGPPLQLPFGPGVDTSSE